MKLKNIFKYLREEGLEGYLYVYLKGISYADHSISVVKKGEQYIVYMCFEKGQVEEMASFYSEEDVCRYIIRQSLIEKKQADEYAYYKQNGEWPSQRR